jgi:DNA-binding PadR family transcriptional regulator
LVDLHGFSAQLKPPFPITPPERLFSRTEVLQFPSPVPKSGGLYAWYFRNAPNFVPTRGCLKVDGKVLLYLGIAPVEHHSGSSLSKRIRQHYSTNAKSSTLRKTLGVLLEEKSKYSLRRIGNGDRITLTDAGEQWLNEWMQKNAFVAWICHPKPWTVENHLLETISCPFNIKGNKHHPFCSTLERMRETALQRARTLPIVN